MEVDPSIQVEEDVRVYRPAEDTYLLLSALEVDEGPFLEVGTGTGLVALHAARSVDALATDVNPHAVRLARANARRNGLSLAVVRADLLRGLRGPFATVAFNPPYLPLPPREDWLDRAWSGGSGGDAVVLPFLEQVRGRLTPGGRVFLLLSSHNERARRRGEPLYRMRAVARRRLFFEELTVWELRPRGKL